MRVPTASVRRAARAFEATTSAFTLPPVIVAYDVDDAERALPVSYTHLTLPTKA